MKGLYIFFDYTVKNGTFVGVLKKVFTQHKLFNDILDEGCELLNLPLRISKNKVILFLSYLFSSKTFDFTSLQNKKYDCVYIRRIAPNSKSVIALLRLLKSNNPNCKIVYELPTYPYDFEHKTFISKMQLLIDRKYRKQLHRYVDRIATLTDDTEIFGCKTLKITNGVDCKSIPVCKKENYNHEKINLIAVAQFAFWHGYERVIEGLHNYGKKDVLLHLVGNGNELEKYKKLVAEYGLEEQVIFYGALSGDELTRVFDTADIALCSLACHKKNIYIASELKSREYLCRGLPVVTSTRIDIIPDNFEYSLRVPEDDSAIDMQKIADFANSLYSTKSRKEITKKIRLYAEENCGMESAMKNVVDYFHGA